MEADSSSQLAEHPSSLKLKEYVIAHELIHIEQPTQSPTVWPDLGWATPDYEPMSDEPEPFGTEFVLFGSLQDHASEFVR